MPSFILLMQKAKRDKDAEKSAMKDEERATASAGDDFADDDSEVIVEEWDPESEAWVIWIASSPAAAIAILDTANAAADDDDADDADDDDDESCVICMLEFEENQVIR